MTLKLRGLGYLVARRSLKNVGLTVLVLVIFLGIANYAGVVPTSSFAAVANQTPSSSNSLLRVCSASTPCPVGISDYGLGPSGKYSYSAVAFESETTFTQLSIGDSNNPSLDHSMEVQLNVVANGVAEGNSKSGVYWTQDVMHIDQTGASSFNLQAENNIWNHIIGYKMGSDYSPNLYRECTSGGTAGDGNRGQYYYCFGPSVQVSLPFTVDFLMEVGTCTASICGSSFVGDSYVAFYYAIYHGNTLVSHLWYDLVAFDSLVKGHPHYEVKYQAVKGSGDSQDAENVLCGNGGGSSVQINSISYAMFLAYLPKATSKRFVYVPHAWSAGAETGETASGVSITQSSTRFVATGSSGTDSEHELW